MRKGLLNNDGTQFYYRINGRFSVISLWNEDDERWIGAVRRGSAAVNLRTVDFQPADGRHCRGVNHGFNSKLQCDDGDDRWFCQRRINDASAGGRRDYGGEYRYNDHRSADRFGHRSGCPGYCLSRRRHGRFPEKRKDQCDRDDCRGIGHLIYRYGNDERRHGAAAERSDVPVVNYRVQ